jgi:hypothetical protein
MSLNWKDAATTLLTAGSVALTVAAVQEWVSFISVRWAIAGMTILGVAACAVGSYNTANVPASYSLLMGGLVIAATVCAVLGLIFGAKGYAIAMASAVVILWLIATVRHAVV